MEDGELILVRKQDEGAHMVISEKIATFNVQNLEVIIAKVCESAVRNYVHVYQATTEQIVKQYAGMGRLDVTVNRTAALFARFHIDAATPMELRFLSSELPQLTKSGVNSFKFSIRAFSGEIQLLIHQIGIQYRLHGQCIKKEDAITDSTPRRRQKSVNDSIHKVVASDTVESITVVTEPESLHSVVTADKTGTLSPTFPIPLSSYKIALTSYVVFGVKPDSTRKPLQLMLPNSEH
ncbi:hypothetical protein B566_EDAN017512 [Ephemera danica]|nr:hypothetical protein B566_EDAN017512 [Ephemera danica]